jgi:membrane-bound serine protease (ClpP class)
MKITTWILAAALALPLLCTSPCTGTTNDTDIAEENDTDPAAAETTPAPAVGDVTATVADITPASEAASPLVFVIPVESMIERGLLYVIRRSFADAVRENATAIILDMDTPGGRVDVAEEIMRLLIDLPDSIRTITYVNKDALSAGSLIAIATDRIYMAPGSRIGASAIVTSGGDIEEGDLKEKHVSALVALARSAAENGGHDPDLVEAMIRKDFEYTLGDEVICKAGQLLTLTDRDAARLIPGTNGVPDRTLLAVATVDSLDALKAAENLQHARFRTVRTTAAEQIARYIEQFAFIFLAGGLLGIYIEFKTPGFGLPGILGGILLAIFFWGHRIAGLSGDIELVLFAIGLLLLLLELLVIPGFGIAGVSGIALIMAAVFFSMVRHAPAMPTFSFPAEDLQKAANQLGLAMAVALVLGMVAARFLPRTQAFQHLVLSTALAGGSAATATGDSSGGSPAANTPMIGTTGTALTPLHPAGFASVVNRRLNVVARGDFIEPGESVVIAEIHGNRIVVDRQRTNTSDETRQS